MARWHRPHTSALLTGFRGLVQPVQAASRITKASLIVDRLPRFAIRMTLIRASESPATNRLPSAESPPGTPPGPPGGSRVQPAHPGPHDVSRRQSPDLPSREGALYRNENCAPLRAP